LPIDSTGANLLYSLAKIALAVAIGLPLIIYLAQDSLIFYRQPLSEARRADAAKRFPAAREIFIQAKDGARQHAWHVMVSGTAPGVPPRPLVIYFGGNAEEVSWMLDRIGDPRTDPARGETPDAGWLLVDYRGYGLSEGSPGEKTLVSDALQWFDHALTLPGVDAKRVYAFGRSLGSGVAVALASQRPVAGLILATPYDSLAAVAKRYYWYVPVDLLLRHRFDSIALAPSMKQPLLCLIAERDAVIPAVHGERLFDAWGGAKRKVHLQEAGHNSTDAHPLFWPAIRDFLAQKVS
jgi:pimeloyl-ACP methyl ester carboxylesterase